MRIALLLLSVFVCWQMVAAGLIKIPLPPGKGHKDHDDCKDKHPVDCCDDKEPEGKGKGEWKKKEDHSSHDHGKGKHSSSAGADLSGLEHLPGKIPLHHKHPGKKGLGGILDLSSGKNDLINLNRLKKSLLLIDYLPGKVIGSKGGKGLLDLKGISGKLPLGKGLPLKGIHGDSDCDDDKKGKKSHGIKRRGLSDDWKSMDDDSKEKHEKDEHDSKKSGGKSKDMSREKNKGKSDAWKINKEKEGHRKGGWNRENKSKDVQISVNLKDKKDSGSWADAWKSKNGKKGKTSSHSWDQEKEKKEEKKEIPCDEDLD